MLFQRTFTKDAWLTHNQINNGQSIKHSFHYEHLDRFQLQLALWCLGAIYSFHKISICAFSSIQTPTRQRTNPECTVSQHLVELWLSGFSELWYNDESIVLAFHNYPPTHTLPPLPSSSSTACTTGLQRIQYAGFIHEIKEVQLKWPGEEGD